MSLPAQVTLTVVTGDTVQIQIIPTGATRPSVDYSFDTASTAREVDVGWVRSTVQMLWMSSDQTITIKTNSSGSPDDTITLTANEPLIVGLAHSVPQGVKTAATFFSADVTKFYIVNGSGIAGTFKLRALIT